MSLATKKTIIDIAAESKLVPLARQAWGNHPLLSDCTARLAGHIYGAYADGAHVILEAVKNSLLCYRSAMEAGSNEVEAYITELLVGSCIVFKKRFSSVDGKGKATYWDPLKEPYAEFLRRANGNAIAIEDHNTSKQDLYYACLLSGATMPLMVTNMLTNRLTSKKRAINARA